LSTWLFVLVFQTPCRQAGGVHILQAFFSNDTSEEVQIQGRTSRQGKSGTYSLILDEPEVRDLGLDPASLRSMQAQACYEALCAARMRKRASLISETEETLKKTNALDSQSHSYFDTLLAGHASLAEDRLKGLYEQLACAGAAFHFVCCYDESGSMRGQPWQQLVEAHFALMQTLDGQPSTKVSIVQFDAHCRTVLQLGNVSQAMQVNLHCNGGHKTFFEPPLARALQLMRSGLQMHSSLIPVLLFMSDGINGDGDCIGTITEIQRAFPTLVFHAVIFRKSDSTQLRAMAQAVPNGHFHVSINGVQLVETFSRIASSFEYTGQQ